MSFRLRVLALLSLVAVTAVGATAVLAFRQASRQVTESAAADRQTGKRIVHELTGYARHHGTWEGVPRVVSNLAAATDQRIKLVTEWGDVVVDSDTEEGRAARDVPNPPVLADPHADLTLPDNIDSPTASSITARAITQYRSGTRFAACLTRRDIDATMSLDEYGMPVYTAHPIDDVPDPAQLVEGCRTWAKVDDFSGREVMKLQLDCALAGSAPESMRDRVRQQDVPVPGRLTDRRTIACLEEAFVRQTDDVAPMPLQVYLGAVDERAGSSLTPGPVIAAAALVAVLAVAGTALLSRRVLRPIGTLIAASQRLGAGDLSLRVPTRGRDELAQLAHSFNRMADSLQRGEERQRRMVADVAHELRTPLANLRGYLEALKDGVIPASPELLASLHEEAVLQQHIVDDLQDLALAEAGTLTYHRTSTDLAELLETCRTAQQAAADAAQVTLTVEADGPVMANVDPDRLRQVIGNLVTNSLRATPSGGTVTLSAICPAGGTVAVMVCDTGVGIAAEDLPHIFDRFWRADAARDRTTGGSGLGLAIARHIVNDHDGTICASSAKGAGTTITITLPG
jgi:two-component system, OmpR family, sensor histidine kinase BaeS